MSFPLFSRDYTFPRPSDSLGCRAALKPEGIRKGRWIFLLPSGLQWMSCQIHASPFSMVGKEDVLPLCVSWYRTHSQSSLTSYIPVINLGSIPMTNTYPSTRSSEGSISFFLVLHPKCCFPSWSPLPDSLPDSPLLPLWEDRAPSVSPTLAYQVSSKLVTSSSLKDPSYHQGPFKEPWNPRPHPPLYINFFKKWKSIVWSATAPLSEAHSHLPASALLWRAGVITERVSQAATVLKKYLPHHHHKYYCSKT